MESGLSTIGVQFAHRQKKMSKKRIHLSYEQKLAIQNSVELNSVLAEKYDVNIPLNSLIVRCIVIGD